MKKIMFKDRFGLTQAVLEGRKTMTRRLVKSDNIVSITTSDGAVHHVDKTFGSYHEYMDKDGKVWLAWSPYKVGEVVAVAQCYEDIWKQIVDGEAHASQCYKFYREHQSSAGWNNKMFVRADIMPHYIRITNIKVEQLQDITDWECLAEGIVRVDLQVVGHETLYSTNNNPAYFYGDSARTAFATLIDKINGKGTWERNPWVFVYTFKIID